MDIKNLPHIAWNNSIEIDFSGDKWLTGNNRTFSKGWLAKYYPELRFRKDNTIGMAKQPGWYWFQTDAPDNYFKSLSIDSPPKTYIDKGFNSYKNTISDKATANLIEVKDALIEDKGKRVVYNGHEIWVSGRLADHFNSPNPRTGALKLEQHPELNKKKYTWSVRVLTKDIIEDSTTITKEDKVHLLHLIKSSMGRRIIESSWRAAYGWPILSRA